MGVIVERPPHAQPVAVQALHDLLGFATANIHRFDADCVVEEVGYTE
jgi:hypothetical protein